MGKQIDCLIIGHNEMDFADYESGVLKMGEHTGAYKDLNLNFVRYDNRATTAAEIFNIIYYNKKDREGEFTPVTLGETFHAAISYLGTYLSRRGFSFDYINSFTDDKEELARKLEENDYMTIAITTTLYVSVFPITGIIGFIKRYNDTAKIIVGGPYVYTQHRAQERISLEYLFGPVIGADIYVISSQGEKALTDILRALKNDTPLDRVDNLCFVTPDGIQWTAISTENNPLPENMVDWSLFPGGIGEYVNIRTAISCPFKCEFCGFPEHAGDYQTAGVDVVEKELNLLSRNATLKNVHFIDDTFNVPLKRFKELLRMMIKNKYPFKWHS
ncbi:MAG: hypothetical protein GY940_26420, partial [bacterium]|nr:hypothetical protein [bacterium]